MRAKPVLTIVLAIGLLFGGSGGVAWGLNRDPNPPPTDYWQQLGFLNVAHQGEEQEAPGNTLFAYKSSLWYRGADMIDMDAYMTSDQQIVLTHDLDPCNTSNAPCGSKISEMTLAELRQLDFAYWFTLWYGTYYGHGDASKPHPYRGIATGDREPPEGFTADDFKIATFDQVLDAFPHTPINIELKAVAGVDTNATAAAAAAALARHPGREKDVIINSFGQAMMDAFHAATPSHLAFSSSEEATLDYLTGVPVTPTPVSIQPPGPASFTSTSVRLAFRGRTGPPAARARRARRHRSGSCRTVAPWNRPARSRRSGSLPARCGSGPASVASSN